MADTISSSRELKIENGFVDGDTRTITLKNPRTDLTSADITALETLMHQSNPIIGDKWGGTFGKIVSAKVVNTQRKKLDISNS